MQCRAVHRRRYPLVSVVAAMATWYNTRHESYRHVLHNGDVGVRRVRPRTRRLAGAADSRKIGGTIPHFARGWMGMRSFLASVSGRGERGEDEGLARTRGIYLRKTRQNRIKNEVRPGAWHLGLPAHLQPSSDRRVASYLSQQSQSSQKARLHPSPAVYTYPPTTEGRSRQRRALCGVHILRARHAGESPRRGRDARRRRKTVRGSLSPSELERKPPRSVWATSLPASRPSR